MISMKWEELTAKDFPKAVRKARGVCVIPLGCLEKHGDHLPVGTDLFQIRAVAEAAVAQEPAVIFPAYYMTQILEAKHQPGTLALPGRLIMDLLDAVCDEIARNGFEKIILLNGHGGNGAWLNFSSWLMGYERPRDFTVYVARLEDFWCHEKMPHYVKLVESKVDGHGGEEETSLMRAIRPELVKMEDLDKPGDPLGRLKHLPLDTPLSWYADCPRHYYGDGATGTAKKGQAALADVAATVARMILAVKRDTVAPKLRKEFHSKTRHTPLRAAKGGR